MSLPAFVSRDQWTELEDAWTELMLKDGPLDGVHEALRLAADKKQVQRIVPLVREHAGLLAGAGRAAEAARLLGAAMLQGGSPGELAGPLFEVARAAWGEESWWASYTAISGLRESVQDMRAAWKSFERLLSLEPGVAVFHGKGWGIGLVTELQGDEVGVRFQTGRQDRFPLSSAIDIFEVLSPDDLRSLVVRDPAELKRLVRQQPLEVLRNVLARFRGRATYAVIKGALSQLGVDSSSFAGWWRRARKEAEASEWFEITGASTKAQVQILASASDPAEGMRRSLRLSGSLASAHARVRDFLAGGRVDEGVRAAALETLDELARDEYAPEEARLGAWLLLRDEYGETPRPLRERVVAAAMQPVPEDPSRPPYLWTLFGRVQNARDQERCIGLLAEVYPDAAVREEHVLRHLHHAAPGMVRGLVQELLEKGRVAELVSHYCALLARPARNPTLLVALAELAETGRLAGEMPIPAHRVQSLVRLAVHLEADRIGNPALQRAQTRLTAALTEGAPSVLRRLLSGVDSGVLRSTLNLAQRGVDMALENALVSIVADLAPELFREDDKPFWETGLWTTRAGLSRRQAELRDLIDVKIPANSEAIGKAASYGDLSENSEWEAAIEEQRNLTARAQAIEAEIRGANLLEEVALPEGVVAPGTSVRYRDAGTGTEHRVVLLGPWDQGGDEVVSYRAPLAQGLLGLSSGERTRIALPSGELEVVVLEVQPVHF